MTAVESIEVTGTQYGIRATIPGGETIEQDIPDQDQQKDRIRELLDQGASDIQALTRPLPEWTVDTDTLAMVEHERAADEVLTIAQRLLEGELSLNAALDEMAPYSDLPFAARTARLTELLSELAYQEAVEDDRIQPAPGQDRRTLEINAERMVDQAVMALLGNAA